VILGGALLVVIMIIAPLVIALALRPLAREKSIELLEERFDGVELEKLDIVPGIGFLRINAKGHNLSVSLPERDDAPPFITMNEFSVEVGLLGLLRDPIRIRMLHLDELRIQIPPKEAEDDAPESSQDGKDYPPAFVIEQLVADDTVLRILPDNPRKRPLQFDLSELRIQSAGIAEPMNFEAVLHNPKPPGEIRTRGKFGPLALPDPGSSPVSGEYVFADADLSDFGGIGGMLYSEGRFDGVLGHLRVDGFTETPDFRLKSASHPVRLRTQFHAVVDGTNGDTLLRPVDAVLEESSFRTEGGVVNVVGTEGKTVCLDARGVEGRIEDFLRLAMKSDPPLMTGEIRFTSKIVIPPGKVDVVKKLILDGEFAIDSALFPDPKIQEKVNQLGEVGRGENREDGSGSASSHREGRDLSHITGTFRLQDGIMRISNLSFAVTGAEVTLEGTFNLVSEEINFQGELRLQSKLSETTEGIKSFLLQLVEPFFAREDTPTVIPIKITGTPDDVSFGVEMSRVLTRQEVALPSVRDGVAQKPWPPGAESCDALQSEKHEQNPP
jgi:hypothetical protein